MSNITSQNDSMIPRNETNMTFSPENMTQQATREAAAVAMDFLKERWDYALAMGGVFLAYWVIALLLMRYVVTMPNRN